MSRALYATDASNYRQGPIDVVLPLDEEDVTEDERISEDINDRLTDHGDLDATDIEVEVNNGEVTLSGSVDSRWAKRTAEDVAESVSGVKAVNTNLRVKQSWQEQQDQKQSQQGRSGQQDRRRSRTATG